MSCTGKNYYSGNTGLTSCFFKLLAYISFQTYGYLIKSDCLYFTGCHYNELACRILMYLRQLL